jgi:hypothetical protein
MATAFVARNTHLGSPHSLTVYYKYVKEMPVYSKPAKEFIQSVVEKYPEYAKLQLELHVSPFYGWRDAFVWQPVVDFDDPSSVPIAKQFCKEELSPTPYKYFVEVTGTSVHIVSQTAYGPIREDQISELRAYLRERFKDYQHLDITSSIRHLPIRRTPSTDSQHRFIIMPIRVSKFLSSSYESLVKELVHSIPSSRTFAYVVASYTLPRVLADIGDAPWGVGRYFSNKKQEVK